MLKVYARTLERAAEMVGGTEQLAFRLKVTASRVAHWIDGSAPTPPDVFLKAVDLIAEVGKSGQQGDRNS